MDRHCALFVGGGVLKQNNDMEKEKLFAATVQIAVAASDFAEAHNAIHKLFADNCSVVVLWVYDNPPEYCGYHKLSSVTAPDVFKS